MLSTNLFKEILVKPATDGANRLLIVSGYATSAMAYIHLNELQGINNEIKVELIIGMTPFDGLSQINHVGFKELMTSSNNQFSCSYLTSTPAVHSKVYTWLKDTQPYISFVGSANYTQNAFGQNQREVMESSNPKQGLEYFNRLTPQTIYCNNIEAENIVRIYNSRNYDRVRRDREALSDTSGIIKPLVDETLVGLPTVTFSLLDKSGNLPQISGLNWGQRQGREPNQAYIKIPATVYTTNFFPPIRTHFTVLTDDGKILICSRAQQNGKAIHTPLNNSQMGEYFRSRLGLSNGAKVSKEDLVRYGRTNVSFYKIDDETYFLDFSV